MEERKGKKTSRVLGMGLVEGDKREGKWKEERRFRNG